MSDKTWVDQIPTHFLKEMLSGSVFHVYVTVEIYNNRCLLYHVMFTLNEGLGESVTLQFPNDTNNGILSIPEQVELLMMDVSCALTWNWTANKLQADYVGEFAHQRNRKCISESNASQFAPIL